jgi:glycosyltransferase involved in cell wall biosynthesis
LDVVALRLAVAETGGHGGLLHYATQLADGLAGRGHAVDLLVSRDNELANRGGPANRLPLFRPPTRPGPPVAGWAYRVRRLAVGARLTLGLARLCFELLRGGYDAVIVQWDVTFAVGALAADLLTRWPNRPLVIYVLHNVRPFNRSDGQALHLGSDQVARRCRRVLPRMDLLLVHGDSSRDEYERTWPPAPLAVIPHGDETVFGDPPPAAAGERILFFGDWRKVKGLPTLLAAFEQVVARRPTVALTVAGAPAPADFDDGFLRAAARRDPDRVRLIDHYVPMADVPALFGTARVVVTPYLTGYQSGVLHLAMTLERAVVTSNVGGLGALVRAAGAGLVVPPGDVAALAAALERLLADPELTDRFAAAGRRYVTTRASWSAVAEQVEAAIVRELVGRSDRTGGPPWRG